MEVIIINNIDLLINSNNLQRKTENLNNKSKKKKIKKTKNKKIPIKKRYKVLYNQSGIHYVTKINEFDGSSIKDIISFVRLVLHKHDSKKVPIFFEFGDVKIKDKLTYIYFESICYSLIENHGFKVYVFWNPSPNIETHGIYSSPLKLLNIMKEKSQKKYSQKFLKDNFSNHYRKVILENNQGNYLGVLMSDVRSFLTKYPVSNDSIQQISEVISELVDNGKKHGKSDCLLDIDISTTYSKDDTDKKFIGVNIVILNYSDRLFHDALKEKMLNSENEKNKRYNTLFTAYKNHKEKFVSKSEIVGYTEEDFWNICCLQDKISGREKSLLSHGTGTTVLIKSLQDKADNDHCYMLSGNRSVHFQKHLLSFNKEQWIGFNKENNFIESIPDYSIIGVCPVFIPGTSYNLNFVLEVEEDDSEDDKIEI